MAIGFNLAEFRFQQWSLEQAKITSGIRQQFAQDWLDKLKKLDLSAVVNEDVLAQIANLIPIICLPAKQKECNLFNQADLSCLGN